MTRRSISSGSPFEAQIGYSRAVTLDTPVGLWCFVSGTTGYDYQRMEMPEDASDQARNTLKTIETTLAEAGCGLEHAVRVRYYATSAAVFEEIIPTLADAFGAVRPAATMVVAQLMRPEMKIEIELDAFRPAPT